MTSLSEKVQEGIECRLESVESDRPGTGYLDTRWQRAELIKVERRRSGSLAENRHR